MWIRDKQFQKATRVPQDDNPAEMEELSNYDEDRRMFPRISDTRFVNEPTRLPSLAPIR